MSEHTHTPGPWRVVEHEIWDTRADGEPGIPLFRRDNNYRRWGRDLKAGEAEANARLIAAAPELLEALRTARVALMAIADSAAEAGFGTLADIIDEQLTKANSAIAIATGEPK